MISISRTRSPTRPRLCPVIPLTVLPHPYPSAIITNEDITNPFDHSNQQHGSSNRINAAQKLVLWSFTSMRLAIIGVTIFFSSIALTVAYLRLYKYCTARRALRQQIQV